MEKIDFYIQTPREVLISFLHGKGSLGRTEIRSLIVERLGSQFFEPERIEGARIFYASDSSLLPADLYEGEDSSEFFELLSGVLDQIRLEVADVLHELGAAKVLVSEQMPRVLHELNGRGVLPDAKGSSGENKGGSPKSSGEVRSTLPWADVVNLPGYKAKLSEFPRDLSDNLTLGGHPNVSPEQIMGVEMLTQPLASQELSTRHLQPTLSIAPEQKDFKTFSEVKAALDFQDRIRVMRDVVSALVELHNKGLVHLDVKSDNVRVAYEDGMVKGKLFDHESVRPVGPSTYGLGLTKGCTEASYYGAHPKLQVQIEDADSTLHLTGMTSIDPVLTHTNKSSCPGIQVDFFASGMFEVHDQSNRSTEVVYQNDPKAPRRVVVDPSMDVFSLACFILSGFQIIDRNQVIKQIRAITHCLDQGNPELAAKIIEEAIDYEDLAALLLRMFEKDRSIRPDIKEVEAVMNRILDELTDGRIYRFSKPDSQSYQKVQHAAGDARSTCLY